MQISAGGAAAEHAERLDEHGQRVLLGRPGCERARPGPQLPIQLLDVEPRRILEHSREVLGIAQATAILRWGGAAPAGRSSRCRFRRRLTHGVDDDPQVPVVAVVVDVLEPVPGLLEQLSQLHRLCGEAILISLFDIELAEEKLCAEIEGIPTGGETPEVVARPVEGGLEHVMNVGQGQIRAQLQSPPDRWGRAVEVDTHRDHLPRRWQRAATLAPFRASRGGGPWTPQVAEQGMGLVRLEGADDLAEAVLEGAVGVGAGGHVLIVRSATAPSCCAASGCCSASPQGSASAGAADRALSAGDQTCRSAPLVTRQRASRGTDQQGNAMRSV